MRGSLSHAVPVSPAVLAPIGVMAAIALSGIWLCHATYFEAATNGKAPAVVEPTDGFPVDEPAPVRHRQTTIGAHLFGTVATAPLTEPKPDPEVSYIANKDLPPEELPLATLGVTVQGIIMHSNHEASYVVLDGSGTQDRSYRTGDEIPGGAAIRYIESNRVVIDRDGELLELPLAELDAVAAQPGSTTINKTQKSTNIARNTRRPLTRSE